MNDQPERGRFPTENLSLLRYEAIIIEALKGRPGFGKQAARSAVRHVNAAWRTRDSDLEMAVLRIITAEEEAAAAIFYSIKRKKYDGHQQINLKSHMHKLALGVFLRMLGDFFQTIHLVQELDLRLDFTEGDGYVSTSFSGKPYGLDGRFKPIPPLHFSMKRDGLEYYFEDEFKQFCERKNIKKMEEHIKELAGMRHSLLYAVDAGIAECKVGQGFFDTRRRWIFFLLAIYVMVDSYREHQLFVLHAVSAFCRMIRYVVPRDVGLES
ncbi:MAG: hypothetical protein ACRD1R_17680 [Acidobacteriota bacterium]